LFALAQRQVNKFLSMMVRQKGATVEQGHEQLEDMRLWRQSRSLSDLQAARFELEESQGREGERHFPPSIQISAHH